MAINLECIKKIKNYALNLTKEKIIRCITDNNSRSALAPCANFAYNFIFYATNKKIVNEHHIFDQDLERFIAPLDFNQFWDIPAGGLIGIFRSSDRVVHYAVKIPHHYVIGANHGGVIFQRHACNLCYQKNKCNPSRPNTKGPSFLHSFMVSINREDFGPYTNNLAQFRYDNDGKYYLFNIDYTLQNARRWIFF